MPPWGQTRSVNVGAGLALVTTAETVIATLVAPSTDPTTPTLTFTGNASILTGATTTGLTFRVRRDSLTGNIVGQAEVDTLAAAAGNTEDHTLVMRDARTDAYGPTYVLTVAQTGATGNGTVQSATLAVTLGG